MEFQFVINIYLWMKLLQISKQEMASVKALPLWIDLSFILFIPHKNIKEKDFVFSISSQFQVGFSRESEEIWFPT